MNSLPNDSLPIVALVGRPNVGKSALFNRLVRKPMALVHDRPGVTRDRHYATVSTWKRSYTLVDTGGFDPATNDPMREGMFEQVRQAIQEANLVLFVSDATGPLTRADEAAIDLLRKSDTPLLFVANKVDNPASLGDACELYRCGAAQVFPVSALHGRGIGDLEQAILEALPQEETSAEPLAANLPRIALLGRPNVGKSSLLNHLLGAPRVLVDNKPGTTRDPIHATVHYRSKPYLFVDTAGIRRKGNIAKTDDRVETLSVMQSLRTLQQAEIVLLLCDATEPPSEQDARLLGLASDKGRAIVVAFNKTDLLSKVEKKEIEKKAQDAFAFAPHVPFVHLSALRGQGMDTLFEEIDRVHVAFFQRISTGELNRFFERVLALRTPPTSGGKAPRLYYITQVGVAPPTFMVSTSNPDAIHISYQRFVMNQIRKEFGFAGVPLRILYRQKNKKDSPRAQHYASAHRAAVRRSSSSRHSRPSSFPRRHR